MAKRTWQRPSPESILRMARALSIRTHDHLGHQRPIEDVYKDINHWLLSSLYGKRK